jgi:hypothetical protein
MPNTLTVTAVNTGAGASTTINFADVKKIDFAIDRQVLTVTGGNPSGVYEFGLPSIVTVTYTIASAIATVTVAGT